jgi:predicted enzyme related to lactoylglutathione lyase
MAKVLGIGGLFFKANDSQAIMQWYARVLGLELADWGGVVFRPAALAAQPGAGTVFSAFAGDTSHFEPSTSEFMFNLVVDDLDGILARCNREGVEPVKLMLEEAMGRFAHIMDPEGRKIELWEPKPMPAA